MTPALTDHTVPFAGRLHREDCNIDDLAALVAHRTDLAEYPYAHSVGRRGSSVPLGSIGRAIVES